MPSIHGTISHSITIGVAGTYTYPSPLTIAVDGYVSNSGSGDAVFSSFANATLNNEGVVMATDTFDSVHFTAGGYIGNTGLINGAHFGIYISGAIGTVSNFGTIGSNSAIFIAGGGIVLNGSETATGGSIAGGDYAVRIIGGGTISNFGNIRANTNAVNFASGGNVFNGSSATPGALIRSIGVGVAGATNITNYGTIISELGVGVDGGAGGTITNSEVGLVDGGRGIRTGATLVFNAGRIDGGYGTAVDVSATDALVLNTGLIRGFAPHTGLGVLGVMLAGNGTVVNGTSLSTDGLISGVDGGVSIRGTGTVINFGVIGSVGIGGGGIVLNGSETATGGSIAGVRIGGGHGTVSNFARILGTNGVYISGGDVFNGSSGAPGALIRGSAIGVAGATNVTNFGTIIGLASASFGVDGGAGGTITNSGVGLIAGANGIRTGVALVSNAGTIVGTTGYGLHMFAPDSLVINTRLIAGATQGIGVYDTGTVTNFGTINGGGGTAILFSVGDDRLVVGPGAAFTGNVNGNAGSDILELADGAGPRTLAGLGAKYLNFESLVFDPGAAWRVTLDTPAAFTGTVFGFSTDDSLALTGLPFDPNATATLLANNVLQISANGGNFTMQFDPAQNFAGQEFRLSQDGTGGTDLSIPCFCRGTLILTEAGEVPVEQLAIGDRAVTLFGEARTIRWVGRRAYDGRFVAGNKAVLPIRIAAGTLSDGVPARDLWLSPEHSLYFDGVLAQAAHLVNGLTIEQAEAVELIEYFHVELDVHDILVADGAPAESYIDCDNRLMFENGAEVAALYPNDDRPRWQFSLPRLAPGSAELTEIRAALLARAERLGHRLDADPDLHLVVGGAVIRPELVDDRVYRFTVPPGSTPVRLASRSTVPAEISAAVGDIRRLGVAISCLRLYDADLCIEASHTHAALDDGFHPDEETHRWTDGWAQIPAAWLRCFAGAFTVEVRLASRDLAYFVPSGGGHAVAV